MYISNKVVKFQSRESLEIPHLGSGRENLMGVLLEVVLDTEEMRVTSPFPLITSIGAIKVHAIASIDILLLPGIPFGRIT